jgi:hypothetical protein
MSALGQKRTYSARLNVEYVLVRDCQGAAGRLGNETTAKVTFNWPPPMRVAQVRTGGMAAIEPRVTGSKNRFSCDFSDKAPGVITCLRPIF